MGSAKKISTAFFILFLASGMSAQKTFSTTVLFETGKFNLTPGNSTALKQFFLSYDSIEIKKISVAAYCDDRGTEKNNKILSEKRANAVRDYLLFGAEKPSFELSSEGRGEIALEEKSQLSVDEQRRLNRKAVIDITYKIKERPIAATPVVVEEKKEENTETQHKPVFTENQKVGDKVVVENILFEGGMHIFLKESYPALKNLGETLLKHKKYHILIMGHVCCVPPGEDGMDFAEGTKNLSVTRAKAVHDYLVSVGVDASRLSYKGMKGDYRTGKGDKYDRRVEVEITAINSEADSH